MKRASRILSVLALSLAVTATSLSSAEARRAKVLSKPQLRAALLTVNDLPKGFKLDKKSGKTSGKTSSSDDDAFVSNDPGCQAFIEENDPGTAGAIARAGVDFTHKGDFAYESVGIGLFAFRSPEAVAKDFAISDPEVRSCHRLGLDMGDGSTMWLDVQGTVRRIDGNRTFVMSMRGHYLGVLMNMTMSISQFRNYEVMTMLVGANKSAPAVAQLSKAVLRAQTAKLAQHLR